MVTEAEEKEGIKEGPRPPPSTRAAPLTLAAQTEVSLQLPNAGQDPGARPVPPQRIPRQGTGVLRGPVRDSMRGGPHPTPSPGASVTALPRAPVRGGQAVLHRKRHSNSPPIPEKPLLSLALGAEADPGLHGGAGPGPRRRSPVRGLGRRDATRRDFRERDGSRCRSKRAQSVSPRATWWLAGAEKSQATLFMPAQLIPIG